MAIAIDTDGKRSVLGCSVQLSEAEPHWRKFLESLQKRGMHGVKLVVSDDHAGLRAARQAVMAGVPSSPQRKQGNTDRQHIACRTLLAASPLASPCRSAAVNRPAAATYAAISFFIMRPSAGSTSLLRVTLEDGIRFVRRQPYRPARTGRGRHPER
jgi:Transposase, Mutator family